MNQFFSSCHAPLSVDRMVSISEEYVGETGFQKIHGKERRFLYDRVEEDVDRLAVTNRILKR